MEELTPITRREVFLAKASGQEVETPTPVTREEVFLDAIANGGGGGGGSADVVVVTTTGSSTGTASMTSTEIKSAVASGKVVILNRDNKLYYEIDLTPGGSSNSVTFYRNSLNTGERVTIDENGNYTTGTLNAGSYSKPSGGIPETDLAQAVKNKLNKFIVTLTPTAADYSGTMDKTPEEITAAYNAGQEIVFDITGMDARIHATQFLIDNNVIIAGATVYYSVSGTPVFITVATSSSASTYATGVYPATLPSAQGVSF